MKQSVYILIFFAFQSTFAQVTFIINKLSKNTPENASIYISGDFENWSGGQEKYKLSKTNKTYFITLPQQNGSINFKFTQGAWNNVETDKQGDDIKNRSYTFSKENDTVFVEVLNWNKNNTIKKSTTTNNVFILSNNFDIPQLKRTRRIWMYLPPNYNQTNQSFPVIYMHDGQNIFDSSASFSGEWEVDETLNKIYEKLNFSFIVVGIDNGQNKRLDEYSPWKNNKYGGGEGDAYLEFVVNTLKPYIDANYKTLGNKSNTAIIGSSMGGLISYYAGLKYPDVFGKIGVFSPAFWFSPEINTFSKEHGNIKNSKIYFLAGGKEGNNTGFQEINETVKGMCNIIDVIKKEGFPTKNIESKVVPNGKHNEELWRTNFEEAVLWLFKN
ncbi:alpha/beta hydrolase [Flaviramulus sp. BrNp1-15]|uniref:alpha/beta hydrolase-fold protein n=1 Tax=Flaviramulus sp. BrNp1-15 TaxID=2916754 RepID=UPI001EE91BC9|nr:alpha/beta hydrolase-fold protein [Flaviramulus sp. BrNp1-15]ULC59183.1 alpha/beta hydrolase [Flaviramulus sp. BrNp1-15]